jgi:hypothetical protein
MLERAARLCMALGTDGLRGELTLMRAARALAALEGDAGHDDGPSARHRPARCAIACAATRSTMPARRCAGGAGHRGGVRRVSDCRRDAWLGLLRELLPAMHLAACGACPPTSATGRLLGGLDLARHAWRPDGRWPSAACWAKPAAGAGAGHGRARGRARRGRR